MTKKAGLWIDLKKAVIFSLADEGAQIKRITSEVKETVLSSGGSRPESMPDQDDTNTSGRMNGYYDEVVSYIRDAESILIFGPGEAKLEIKKRLETLKLHVHIVGVETAKIMTDNQIVSKIRQRFLK